MEFLAGENDYDGNMKKGWVLWPKPWFWSKNKEFKLKPFIFKLTSHAWVLIPNHMPCKETPTLL